MAWAGDARLAAGPEDAGFLESVFVPGARLGVRADDPLTIVEVVEYFDGRECAATRLRVSGDPVVGWEAGAGVDHDIGDADVAAAGFHSDSEATGAIADAEGWAPVWIGRTRTGTVASIIVPGQMATSPLA